MLVYNPLPGIDLRRFQKVGLPWVGPCRSRSSRGLLPSSQTERTDRLGGGDPQDGNEDRRLGRQRLLLAVMDPIIVIPMMPMDHSTRLDRAFWEVDKSHANSDL